MSLIISRRKLIAVVAGMAILTVGNGKARPSLADEAEEVDAQVEDAEEPAASYSSDYQVNLADLSMDGYWGVGTTAVLQSYLKTTVTGQVLHQYAPNINANPGLTTGWNCDNTLQGDPFIRLLQLRLGTTTDGVFGTNDIRALQAKMGTTVDGVLSAPSACIKKMQNRLNAGYLF